jgi:glycine cleavage system aminomethyltransferase T
MSVLDFLSPYKAQTAGPFTPVMHSAMERRLRDAGAQFELRDGWMVATSVPGSHTTPGVKDVSNVGKFEVRGDLNGFSGSGIELIPITPERGLAVCDYTRCADVHRQLLDHFDLVTDMTAAFSGLEIKGPGATTVMRRLTELDLDNLPTAGAVSHIAATIVRDGDEAYRLYFAQEYAHYFWEVAVDAAEPLGGGPTA